MKQVHLNKEYVILEKDGIPIAALMDVDEFEDYLELQDPKVKRDIEISRKESSPALVSLPLMAAAKTCSPISPLFRLKASKHSQKAKRFPSTSRVALKGSKQQISAWLTKHTHWILEKPGSPGFFVRPAWATTWW